MGDEITTIRRGTGRRRIHNTNKFMQEGELYQAHRHRPELLYRSNVNGQK